ncbi:MAG TPA: TadE/TadG family type IV pilus assembly protein [Novosphingobium sp.]|nr:TadE/TadG family type IV pilus assembly protein [Novosphingobium sp.]
MVNRTLAKTIDLVGNARTFLARLGRNTAGNVLALVAASLPPILILVGGGVDMSRAYMAQTSLQNACDAGVLAGRRAQAKSGTWGTAEQAKAQKMFNINYQGTAANATNTTFTPTNPSTGVISATATTTIPTTIMKIFGTNTFTLTANCSAEFQISNIDVMMVLDTTGSMADCPDGSWCNSGAGSKIEGLKSAVRSFYYTIAAAVPSGSSTRVRFGFVPYNGTVNLKNLTSGASPAIPQGYIASSASYQTRLYNFDQANYTSSTGNPVITLETYGGSTPIAITSADCDNYGINAYPTNDGNPVTTGAAPNDVVTKTYSKKSWTKTGTITLSGCGNCQGNNGQGNGNKGTKVDVGTCVRQVSTVTTSYVLNGYKLNPTTPYRYTQASLDTSTLKTYAAVNLATDVNSASTVPTAGYYDMVTLGSLAGTSNITKTSTTWSGCIEERSTVNSLISAASIPAGATDLDVLSAPTGTTSTQWKPYISAFQFDRNQVATLDTSTDYNPMSAYCPPAAKNFTTVDTSAPATVPSWIETYLGTLYAWGGTYHDIGMIWGARLANPNGINSATVNSGNVSSVSRHIIFLTDGEMAPRCKGLYSAYGHEYLDNRVMPAQATTDATCDATLTTYHNGRYLAACQKAKDMGYTIWVVGFGQAITSEMTACAAGSGGQAIYASSTTALQDTFRLIASRIANLRLRS